MINAKTVSDENTAMLPENKQSKSAIITKKTNTLLILIAVGMLVVFVIGAVLTANRNQSDFSDVLKKVNTVQEDSKQTDIPYLHPTVDIDPEEIKLEDQPIGEEAFRQIMISVVSNPIKVTDASLSLNMEGLTLDAADCTARAKIIPNTSCTLNLSWKPTEKENKTLFIIVKYDELVDENTSSEKDAKKDLSKKINLVLQTKEPEKVTEEPKEEEKD